MSKERERDNHRECVKPVDDESEVIGNGDGQRRTILLVRIGDSTICHLKGTIVQSKEMSRMSAKNGRMISLVRWIW